MSLTDDAVRAIATLSELEVLDIGGHFPQATLEPWSLLKNVHNLTELRFDMNCHVTDGAVQAISRGCPKLRYLSVSGCRPHVTSQGLSSLTALKHLTSLNISYILQVKDELLEKLASKGVLERLWLRTCLDVTETGVQRVLELCSRLTLLDLSNNTSLMTTALSPLTSGLCDMHPERQLEVIIGGTTMLFQEAETGTTSLETGLPSWVTLTRVNRANRYFNDDDMIYLPEPWSDEEAGDDFEEMDDLFEEGENAEGQGHLQEGVDVLGDGDKQPERNAQRDRVSERNAAERNAAEELGIVARKGHAEARSHAFLAEGGNHDGSHLQDKSKSAPQERNDRESSKSNTEAKGSNSHVIAEVKKTEQADGVGAAGGGDGGDSLVARTEVIKDTCPSAVEEEEEESWEGEDVPAPARVAQPAPLPRIGRFQDVGDFDEDYDEFLDNDDPLEFERWEMS
ncbi:hypothetical protein V1264_022100 [Littorina saxatilis]|uniref:F-box/LRR-repeat protein 15-like leucin rich repeat domain-containing protein n=2 Tax=Littorina saxatilis TaxID=31220 RepID=A0AAN9AJJ8_9CAEN